MEEREREAVLTYVEVPILLGSPEDLGIYPWVALSLEGRRSSSNFFICSRVPSRKEKEKPSLCMWRDWYILMGSLEVWEQHQVVFPQENPLVQEPPLQHNFLWPTLSGGNIIGLGGN
jgi:hypothetical protein